MQEPGLHTGEKTDEILLHVYKGCEGTVFDWYMDDGESFGFETGIYALRRITHDGRGLVEIGPTEGSFVPSFRRVKLVLHGFGESVRVELDGKEITSSAEQHSFFLPMEKFDPLADAEPVGSEMVNMVSFPYRPGAISVRIG